MNSVSALKEETETIVHTGHEFSPLRPLVFITSGGHTSYE